MNGIAKQKIYISATQTTVLISDLISNYCTVFTSYIKFSHKNKTQTG